MVETEGQRQVETSEITRECMETEREEKMGDIEGEGRVGTGGVERGQG